MKTTNSATADSTAKPHLGLAAASNPQPITHPEQVRTVGADVIQLSQRQLRTQNFVPILAPPIKNIKEAQAALARQSGFEQQPPRSILQHPGALVYPHGSSYSQQHLGSIPYESMTSALRRQMFENLVTPADIQRTLLQGQVAHQPVGLSFAPPGLSQISPGQQAHLLESSFIARPIPLPATLAPSDLAEPLPQQIFLQKGSGNLATVSAGLLSTNKLVQSTAPAQSAHQLDSYRQQPLNRTLQPPVCDSNDTQPPKSEKTLHGAELTQTDSDQAQPAQKPAEPTRGAQPAESVPIGRVASVSDKIFGQQDLMTAPPTFKSSQDIPNSGFEAVERQHLLSQGSQHLLKLLSARSLSGAPETATTVPSSQQAISTAITRTMALFDFQRACQASDFVSSFEGAISKTFIDALAVESTAAQLPQAAALGSTAAAKDLNDQALERQESSILQQLHQTQVSLYEQLLVCRLDRIRNSLSRTDAGLVVKPPQPPVQYELSSLATPQPVPASAYQPEAPHDDNSIGRVRVREVTCHPMLMDGHLITNQKVSGENGFSPKQESWSDRNNKSDKYWGGAAEGGDSRGPARFIGPNEIKKRQILDCPHTDKPYYAKGMCVNCYHRQGRTKKAWNCPHNTKTHYSKGLCKYCYLASYYKNRTIKRGRKTSPSSDVNEAPQETQQATEQSEDHEMQQEEKLERQVKPAAASNDNQPKEDDEAIEAQEECHNKN